MSDLVVSRSFLGGVPVLPSHSLQINKRLGVSSPHGSGLEVYRKKDTIQSSTHRTISAIGGSNRLRAGGCRSARSNSLVGGNPFERNRQAVSNAFGSSARNDSMRVVIHLRQDAQVLSLPQLG